MKEILRNIKTFDDVVFEPDHPYGYFNPNAIARKRNKIYCLFEPSNEEKRTPNKILYRLLNTRIVYPPHSIMIIILGGKSDFRLKYELDKVYFDLAVTKKDLIISSKSITNEERTTNEIKSLKEIQKQNFNFQANNYLNNINYIENLNWEVKQINLLDDSLSKPKYFDTLFKKDYRPRSNIYKGKETYIGFRNLTDKRSDLYELKPFFLFSMRMNYKFDNGNPFHERLRKKVVSLNSIPKSTFDINKPIRILSLFGWLISNSNDMKVINDRIKFY